MVPLTIRNPTLIQNFHACVTLLSQTPQPHAKYKHPFHTELRIHPTRPQVKKTTGERFISVAAGPSHRLPYLHDISKTKMPLAAPTSAPLIS